MEDSMREKLIEVGKVLYTMPFRIVFKQWFNEAARASNAIDYIKKKGLWEEYLCERELNKEMRCDLLSKSYL